MPCLTLSTNLPSSKLTKEFNLQLLNCLADILNKPKELCSVNLIGDQNMTFGGSNEPNACVSVISIGNMGPEENKMFSNRIMSELEDHLGISPSRVSIKI